MMRIETYEKRKKVRKRKRNEVNKTYALYKDQKSYREKDYDTTSLLTINPISDKEMEEGN